MPIMKLLSQAFKATLEEFGIKGFQMAEQADVSTGMVSTFKNGSKAITTDSLEKILAALPDEAFEFWVSQLLHCRKLQNFTEHPPALDQFVEQLDSDATSALLNALARKIRKEGLKKQAETVAPL